MRILAIDFGTKHTGFALGDNGVSMPYSQVSSKSVDFVVEQTLKILNTENIEQIIVGLPVAYNNIKIQDNIKNFIKSLSQKTNININTIDEDFSSKEAFEDNFEKFSDIKHIKKIIHKTSAEKILQNYYLANPKERG